MDDLLKEQMVNAPHLKQQIQKQLDKKMPPKAAPVREKAKMAEQAKKKPEPEKEAAKDDKQKNFLDLYWQQMNILIKASEETKQKMEKLHTENRTINTNMVKLLRRVEVLESKMESTNASIPEF